MRQTRVTEEFSGDTAADINKQYGLCVTYLWAACALLWAEKSFQVTLVVNLATVNQPVIHLIY